MSFRSVVLFVLALAVAGSAAYLWRSPRPRVDHGEREQNVVVPSPAGPTPVPSPSPVAAPRADEVQAALDRVFLATLLVDEAARPAFVAGDFNGDDIVDLAVAARPRGPQALGSLNGEIPGWMTQDATATPPATGRPAPVTIAAEDALLAVIHGGLAGGWRDPAGVQGYLVKNARGSGVRQKALSAVPDDVRMRALRVHRGDVVATTRAGEPGVVYWTGAAYVWAGVPGAGAAASSTGS
jgi:hypothetical protein